MRSSRLRFSVLIMIAALIPAAVACAPPVAGATDSDSTGGSKKSKTSTKTTDADDDDDTTTDDDDDTAGHATAGDDDDSTTTTATPSKFACSGTGIAAYADALVKAARKSCTSDGTGAVRKDNYQCVKTAIDSTGPAHPDTSYSIVTTLLAPNDEFPNLECTYFIQMVTSGVCGTPLSPTDMKWTDYPYAKEFINKAPAGWTWSANTGKAADVKLGDIFVYDAERTEDPGHIMIVAEILAGGKFRIAEANELTTSGSPAMEETGVMSNTRVTSLTDADQRPAGWFRLNAK